MATPSPESEAPETPGGARIRPKTGRYVLLVLFWVFWGGVIVAGFSRMHSRPLQTAVIGLPVLSSETVRGWVVPLSFRTLPYSNREILSDLVSSHPWISQASIKLVLGEGRIVRVRLKAPLAVLLPSYGFLAFQVQKPQAAPLHSSYLVEGGQVLFGESIPGTGALPQVIVKSPLTHDVGRRLARTIQTVARCWRAGSPAGSWYSLNGPHEIRFDPGRQSPVLLLGTDLGCAPFRLYDSFVKHSGGQAQGKIPEAVDLRFSGMLVLRPVLDPPKKTSGREPVSLRS